MAPILKRKELQDLVNTFARASHENRAALIRDPKAVLEHLTGASLGSLDVRALTEANDNTMVVVVPYEVAPDELEPAELDTASGGASVGHFRLRIFDPVS